MRSRAPSPCRAPCGLRSAPWCASCPFDSAAAVAPRRPSGPGQLEAPASALPPPWLAGMTGAASARVVDQPGRLEVATGGGTLSSCPQLHRTTLVCGPITKGFCRAQHLASCCERGQVAGARSALRKAVRRDSPRSTCSASRSPRPSALAGRMLSHVRAPHQAPRSLLWTDSRFAWPVQTATTAG